GDFSDFRQGKRSFIELMFGNTSINEAADQILNALRGWTLQRARGAFHGVGEADDGDFLGLWSRPRIAEAFLPYVRDVLRSHVHDLATKPSVTLLLKSALIKIGDQRGTVMLLDDIHDLGIELALERKVHPFLDMRDNDQCAHGRRQFIVRVV